MKNMTVDGLQARTVATEKMEKFVGHSFENLTDIELSELKGKETRESISGISRIAFCW